MEIVVGYLCYMRGSIRTVFKGASAYKQPLTSSRSSMKMDIPYHVLCQLVCMVVTVHSLCTKQDEVSRIEAPGYKTLLVHTNKVSMKLCYFSFMFNCLSKMVMFYFEKLTVQLWQRANQTRTKSHVVENVRSKSKLSFC